MKNPKKLMGSAVILSLLLLIAHFNLLWYPEFKLQDMAYQRPTSVDPPDIAIFAIDEQSLSELGMISDWSRYVIADAISILNSDEDYKPAVIAVDILLAQDRDKEADDYLAQVVRESGNVVVVSQALMGYDDQLREVVVDYIRPYPALEEASTYGMANGIMDRDGVIRNVFLQAKFGDEQLYSFPYEVYKKYNGGYAEDFWAANNEAYLTYSGKPSEVYDLIPFSEVFYEDFDPGWYGDSIVFIGPYAAGMMDEYYTPMSSDTKMYGVEIHANAVHMMNDGNFKKYAPEWVNLLVVFVAAILLTALAQKADIRILLAAVVFAGIAYVFAALQLFDQGTVLGLIYPILAMVVLYLYELIYGYVLETIEKQKVRSAFKKYVDPKLVDKLMESGEADSHEVGVKKHIAVLFVDVRGFTPMTETLKDQPEMVVKILNEYLELTSSAVFNNGGSVDKFIGDATMALFNGFVHLDDYEFKAVKAAWDIVQGAVGVNASIKEKYGVDVGFGVGVNSGEAIVGNLGPTFRKDYTAIGDAVNTAARLEANSQRSQVLISAHLYEAVKDRIDAISVGEIPLKGKSERLEIFSVEGIREL